MQVDKRQAWKIYVHAKAKRFDFKLKATINASLNFLPFSFELKLRRSHLKVRSAPQTKSRKSKFLRVLANFHPNKHISAGLPSSLGHAVANFLDRKCFGSLLSESIARRTRIALVLLIVCILSCTILFYLCNVVSRISEGHVSRCVWWGWKFASASFAKVSFAQCKEAQSGSNLLGPWRF